MAIKTLKNKYNMFVDYNKGNLLTEQFKSETPINNVKFPEELGEEHPFDFKILEGVYKHFGLATGVVDKYVDFIVGPGFYVKSKNEKAKQIIEDFMHDVNFDTVLRAWTKQALVKGTSPLELGMEGKNIDGLKTLNADYVYVKRNNKGEVELFNQYTGAFNRNGTFAKTKKIEFKPKQIAFLVFNQMGDSPYGCGILSPTLNIINNLLKAEKDMHTLIGRKANSPLHIILGNADKDDIPSDEEVTNFGQKLEYMTNKQEWCTGPNVKMEVVDFGNLSEKFATVIEHDVKSFLRAVQVPEVLIGEGSIPEGLAGVQMDAFMRRVQSFQAEIEKIVELQIFNVVLSANGIQADVEFEWGHPSDAEKNDKIMKITTLLQNAMLNSKLRNELELQLAELMGIDADLIIDSQEERDNEEKRSQPLVPGQQKEPAQDSSKPPAKKEKESLYSKEWYIGELVHED